MTHIVFVDSQQSVLDEMAGWISANNAHWQVHFATSAESALQLMEPQRFDCVVSDMDMPGISGAELFNHVAQHQPDAVRIARSDNTDAELTLESLHATHRFIPKSLGPAKVCQNIEQAFELRERLHDPELRELITGITSLPVLPEIYDRLMLELASENFSLHVISQIIETDISLSATLLKIVNSPYYGLVQHVQSATHAVNLLGIEVIKNILLTENVVSQFKQFSPAAKRISELNLNASIRGVLANRFARIARLPKRQIDHCQMAGMLSALGELVVESQMIDRQTLDNKQFHHDLIGSSILGLWTLPDVIVEAILHQSDVAPPSGSLNASHVLHTIRLLESALEKNNGQFDAAFEPDVLFSGHPLDGAMLEKWYDCFCDYHLDLKQAA